LGFPPQITIDEALGYIAFGITGLDFVGAPRPTFGEATFIGKNLVARKPLAKIIHFACVYSAKRSQSG
jgi:hypothetical protein